MHLHLNHIVPELHNQNNKEPIYGRYEKKGLGTVVKDLKVDGKLVETRIG